MQRGRILLACSFLLITACSGAENEDLFDPAVTDQKPVDPAAATGGSSTTPPPADQGGGATASGSSSTGSTPGAPGSSDPGTAGGSTKTDPPPPAATCAKEIEPNGTLQNATSFTACISGELGSREHDFSEIVAPKTAKEIVIKHEESGKVSYRIYVDGVSLPLYTQQLPSSMTVMPGATYAFEAIGAESATWKLEISFQ
jgi:hypothetical protein